MTPIGDESSKYFSSVVVGINWRHHCIVEPLYRMDVEKRFCFPLLLTAQGKNAPLQKCKKQLTKSRDVIAWILSGFFRPRNAFFFLDRNRNRNRNAKTATRKPQLVRVLQVYSSYHHIIVYFDYFLFMKCTCLY